MMRARAAAGLAMMVIIASQPRTPAGSGVTPPEISGGTWMHYAAPGDTLAALGARFGVAPATLAADNALRADARLTVDQPLRIDNRHIVPAPVDTGSLVVNLPQRMLFLGGAAGRVEAFPVAVGRASWPTPLGGFTVLLMERNPTWDVPESILEEARRAGRILPLTVPPGPGNPLGAFWIGLSFPGIGIHGTNVPSSIFSAATHGCIRMHPDDIASLFERVAVGSQGRTIYAPVLLAVENGLVYVESHPDVYRRAGPPETALRALADARGITDRIDWAAAEAAVRARHGVARDVTAGPGSSHRPSPPIPSSR
jgi:L,D-transpeptidase ErfK/SrfK